MRVAGYQGTTLLDFPQRVASVLFLAGCNLRCPFCHNPSLVDPAQMDPAGAVAFEIILEKLRQRSDFISGVVFTGGEPLMAEDLGAAILDVKQLGLKVKIDTNGVLFDRLTEILPLVDYVAMDLKTAPSRYLEATGGFTDFAPVARSLDSLVSSGIDFELRTTVVPGLVDMDLIEEIAGMVQGVPLYALQPFVPVGTLDPDYALRPATSRDVLQRMADSLKGVVQKVIIRSL